MAKRGRQAQSELFPAPHFTIMCGIDEAGRGPLAGAVFAAAVILNPARPVRGLKDSKQLSAKMRETLAARIQERAMAWSVARASVEEIDTLNILGASLLAMRRAVDGLAVRPQCALVDGNVPPRLSIPVQTVVQGDVTVRAISAASILAKTARDAYMLELHEEYPMYGFARHMGYGTAEHLDRLRHHGACPHHRRSFAPVRAVLAPAATFGPAPAGAARALPML